MTYEEILGYLYNKRPAFERQGAQGYKPGLHTAETLDTWCGHPHRHYRTIHVAGTNGKGSVSHLLAAVLQLNGYRVGLFTSPHFVDFRERIRVNGEMISRERVVDFVERYQQWGGCPEASFFELTTAMAFEFFAVEEVDIAIIEVGLGGRLDSTNIITPVLSVITNISLDHTEFLGDTLAEIAAEKAGIIKAGVPVVIGEAEGEVREVFERVACAQASPVSFAQDHPEVVAAHHRGLHLVLQTTHHGEVRCGLVGDYQVKNANTALAAIEVLKQIGLRIGEDEMKQAFNQVVSITGFRGRWTKLGEHPPVIADSAHNVAGITAAMAQLALCPRHTLRMVVGMMADKDLEHILPLLPQDAVYYFTQAHTPRALAAERLCELASTFGLMGGAYDSVSEAVEVARSDASTDDLIYVGGSMYVLAELFAHLDSIQDR